MLVIFIVCFTCTPHQRNDERILYPLCRPDDGGGIVHSRVSRQMRWWWQCCALGNADAYGETCRGCPLAAAILILTPWQTMLLQAPLTRTLVLLGPILPTCQRSPRALELRMLPWNGNDASLLDCVNLGDAQERWVQRWLAGGEVTERERWDLVGEGTRLGLFW
jgi:hypothetical protein